MLGLLLGTRRGSREQNFTYDEREKRRRSVLGSPNGFTVQQAEEHRTQLKVPHWALQDRPDVAAGTIFFAPALYCCV